MKKTERSARADLGEGEPLPLDEDSENWRDDPSQETLGQLHYHEQPEGPLLDAVHGISMIPRPRTLNIFHTKYDRVTQPPDLNHWSRVVLSFPFEKPFSILSTALNTRTRSKSLSPQRKPTMPALSGALHWRL